MIRAVLWDNDGVLVDTEKFYYRANRDQLRELGVDLSPELYLEINLRRGRSVLDLALEAGARESDLPRLRHERDARYVDYLRAGVDVIEGVRDCLEELHGRWPMAIVTSAPRPHFELVHGRIDLLRYFEFALTPDLYDRHKPHPEPYLTAADRLGLDPSECLVVEDSERGLRSATAAGMRCLVIPHGLSRDSDWSAAEEVLESVREVPHRVRRLAGPDRTERAVS